MLSLLRRSSIARGVGYCIAFLAGAIKYFPFILLGLVVRERRRVGIPIALASLVGLLFFWHIYAVQILEGLPHIARGTPFGGMLGAKNLPLGIAVIVDHITGSQNDAIGAMAVTIILLLVIISWMMITLRLRANIPAALHRLDEPRRLALLAGGLLLSGCFVAGQSVGYRGIFLLLVLPGLFGLARDVMAGWMASAARLAAISIPPLMWAEAMRSWIHIAATGQYPPPGFISVLSQPLDFIAWCGREIVWWVLVAFLVTILLGFVADRLALGVPDDASSVRPEA